MTLGGSKCAPSWPEEVNVGLAGVASFLSTHTDKAGDKLLPLALKAYNIISTQTLKMLLFVYEGGQVVDSFFFFMPEKQRQ